MLPATGWPDESCKSKLMSLETSSPTQTVSISSGSTAVLMISRSDCCHFIDLAMFLAGSQIVSVSAESMTDAHSLNNTVVINLKMQDGSIGSVIYFSNGNKSVPKENIEIFSGGIIAQIEDFKTLRMFGEKQRIVKYKSQDKGHAAGIREFLKSIQEGSPCPVPLSETMNSMLATCAVNDSITSNRKIFLDDIIPNRGN